MNESFSPTVVPPQPFQPPHGSASTAKMRWFVFVIIVLGILSAPALLTTPVGQRGVLAASVGGLIFMLLMKSPRDGVLLTLIYLSLLGGLRRWLIPAFGWAAQDPLVLVQAAIIGLYFTFILASRRLDWDTRLAKCLGWLLIIMALEVVNPLQGGITVGLGGILFMLVPPLWYYAGRRLGTAQNILNLIRLTLVISVAGAIYGLYQTWFGYQEGEQIWVKLHSVGDIRPFSFFTLMPEYAVFLTFGIAIFWAAVLKGNRAAIFPIPLLVIAIFFLSSRGTVIGMLFVCTGMWAVQGKSVKVWLPRAAVAIALACIGLVWSMQEAQNVDFGTQTQALVEHQTSGLLDPGSSSAPGHASMVYNGLINAFKFPLGHGLGSTSLAAATFGAGAQTTESDWGDSFVALGLPGGLLYSFIIGIVLLTAVQQWRKTRSFASLAVFGILLAGLSHWLYGNFYAMTMLSWFLIGAQDRLARLNQAAENLPGITYVRDQKNVRDLKRPAL